MEEEDDEEDENEEEDEDETKEAEATFFAPTTFGISVNTLPPVALLAVFVFFINTAGSCCNMLWTCLTLKVYRVGSHIFSSAWRKTS